MNQHGDAFPDFQQDCLMTTKDGYLLAKGARATTSVDVNAPEQICTAVKYLFELAQQRPHEPGKHLLFLVLFHSQWMVKRSSFFLENHSI